METRKIEIISFLDGHYSASLVHLNEKEAFEFSVRKTIDKYEKMILYRELISLLETNYVLHGNISF
jgi:hypothetical protein